MRLATLDACRKALADFSAIDFYFARQLVELLPEGEYDEQWFECLLLLSYFQRQGHSCFDIYKLANTTWLEDESLQQPGIALPDHTVLDTLILKYISYYQDAKLLHYTSGRLYTDRYWTFENSIASFVNSRGISAEQTSTQLSSTQWEAIHAVWPHLFSTAQNSDIDWQSVATAMSLVQGITVINGGPGTGKTYTVARVIMALLATFGTDLKIKLAAPTGKAAQRMSESIGTAVGPWRAVPALSQLVGAVPKDAQTLHRLLGVSRFGINTRINSEMPLDCDVLIVDECSMVDVAMFARLLRGIRPSCKLILLGDADQLPSVETGNILADLVNGDGDEFSPESQKHLTQFAINVGDDNEAANRKHRTRRYHVTLQQSHRFSGVLGQCAIAIRQGDGLSAWQFLEQVDQTQQSSIFEGVGVMPASQPKYRDTNMLKLLASEWFSPVQNSQTASEALENLNTRRWLTPLRNGPVGVVQLNSIVELALGVGQSRFNSFYRGRPIMVVENHYAQRLFNGDVGIVWPDDSGVLYGWFYSGDDTLRKVSLSRLPAVETVYAMTVHKSQGSEFKHVMQFLPESLDGGAGKVCTRELLYTGLTRAKKGCVFNTSAEAFQAVVGQKQLRFSGLSDELASVEKA